MIIFTKLGRQWRFSLVQALSFYSSRLGIAPNLTDFPSRTSAILFRAIPSYVFISLSFIHYSPTSCEYFRLFSRARSHFLAHARTFSRALTISHANSLVLACDRTLSKPPRTCIFILFCPRLGVVLPLFICLFTPPSATDTHHRVWGGCA